MKILIKRKGIYW